jgi:hypothetical protein
MNLKYSPQRHSAVVPQPKNIFTQRRQEAKAQSLIRVLVSLRLCVKFLAQKQDSAFLFHKHHRDTATLPQGKVSRTKRFGLFVSPRSFKLRDRPNLDLFRFHLFGVLGVISSSTHP